VVPEPHRNINSLFSGSLLYFFNTKIHYYNIIAVLLTFHLIGLFACDLSYQGQGRQCRAALLQCRTASLPSSLPTIIAAFPIFALVPISPGLLYRGSNPLFYSHYAGFALHPSGIHIWNASTCGGTGWSQASRITSPSACMQFDWREFTGLCHNCYERDM